VDDYYLSHRLPCLPLGVGHTDQKKELPAASTAGALKLFFFVGYIEFFLPILRRTVLCMYSRYTKVVRRKSNLAPHLCVLRALDRKEGETVLPSAGGGGSELRSLSVFERFGLILNLIPQSQKRWYNMFYMAANQRYEQDYCGRDPISFASVMDLVVPDEVSRVDTETPMHQLWNEQVEGMVAWAMEQTPMLVQEAGTETETCTDSDDPIKVIIDGARGVIQSGEPFTKGQFARPDEDLEALRALGKQPATRGRELRLPKLNN